MSFCTVKLEYLRRLSLSKTFCSLCSVLSCTWPCLACCWFYSSRFFSSFLPFSTLSAALRAHRRFDILLAVLVPVLLLYIFFSPLARLLWLRLYFSLTHWLLGYGSVSDPLQSHFVVVYCIEVSLVHPTPLLNFVVTGSRWVLGLLITAVHNAGFC